MKNRKFLALTLAVVSCAVMAGAAELKAEATSGNVSAGNFAADEGRVAFYESDIHYVKNEIGLLQSEIDYSVLNTGSSAHVLNASAGSRKNMLHSRGTVNYDSGKVVISATDLVNFADGIDRLEEDYRKTTTAALNNMGTYFDTDGNASHTAIDGAGYVPSSCAQLAAGILQSQSVDHPAVSPVTADNITAGAAAWVNGQCIVGNGADNDRSYQRGREDGSAGSDGDVDIRYTYHTHVDGNGDGPIEDDSVVYTADDPGGCYREAGHTHNKTEECPAGSQYTMQLDSYTEYGDNTCGVRWYCRICHEVTKTGRYTVGESPHPTTVDCPNKHYTCGSPVNTWVIGCGKSAGQIESATIVIRGNSKTSE